MFPVPGGVTLPPTVGEDAGKVQTIGARYSRGEMTLEQASLEGCRACGTPGVAVNFWVQQPQAKWLPKH